MTNPVTPMQLNELKVYHRQRKNADNAETAGICSRLSEEILIACPCTLFGPALPNTVSMRPEMTEVCVTLNVLVATLKR